MTEDEIRERIERACKSMCELPKAKIHMPEADTFVEVMLAQWEGDLEEDTIREFATAALINNGALEA